MPLLALKMGGTRDHAMRVNSRSENHPQLTANKGMGTSESSVEARAANNLLIGVRK